MSFLKIFPKRKSKEGEKELKGPCYLPLDTLDLDSSISAVSGNLFLNCKSCKILAPSTTSRSSIEESVEGLSSCVFSGLLGIISKGIFILYHLNLNGAEVFECKVLQNIQIQHANNPLLRPVITSAKWIRLKKQRNQLTVLVLLSNVGVSIYSEDGSRRLCCHEYQEPGPELMCRNVGATASQILAGNGRGEIHVFDFIAGRVQFRRTDKVQNEPIAELCCRRGILASGSPSGAIRVWKIRESKAIKVCCFKTLMEECVTGLGLWEGCVIATYGSGMIRIFHLESRKMLSRIAAHARWIVSMDLLGRQGLLLTVAEDDAVLIWKLGIESAGSRSLAQGSFGSIKNIKNKIKNVHRSNKMKRKKPRISVELDSSISAENMLLVGGRFISCSGNVVALTNYGAKEIYFYSRIISEQQRND